MGSGLGARLVRRFVDARGHEVEALWLAALVHFFVLTSYYVVRPIRDDMGVAGGVANIPLLWIGTLAATLAAQPLFAALVARWPRRRVVPATYRFFALNLVLFFVVLEATSGRGGIWVGRVFYVWTAVFSLFTVSAFWAFLVDVFGPQQGKRLFGFIAAGGSVGAIAGSTITAALAEALGPVPLLLVSALTLEVAVRCVRRLGHAADEVRAAARSAEAPPEEAPAVGGGLWAGITHLARSPYLLGIAAFFLLFTIGSTFLYIQQAAILDVAYPDRAARTALFARVDLTVNALTLAAQVWLTARLMRRLGVGLTLALIPALSVVGFLGLAAAPTVGTVVAFQILRRAGNFAVSRPTREVLYTVLPREDKYKAKSFLDTFVYRLGDALGAGANALLAALGFGVVGISLVAAPLAALWLAVSLALGRRHRQLAAAGGEVPEAAAAAAPVA